MQQEHIPMCKELPFCGLPSYSCRQLHTGYFTTCSPKFKLFLRCIIYNCVYIFSGFWLPGPAPMIDDEVHVNATKPLQISDHKWQLRLTMNGTNIQQTIKNDKKWDFIEETFSFFRKLFVFDSNTPTTECAAIEMESARFCARAKWCKWAYGLLRYGHAWTWSTSTRASYGIWCNLLIWSKKQLFISMKINWFILLISGENRSQWSIGWCFHRHI